MPIEAVFVPRPGQVDYTNIRYCPVINCVVFHQGRMLILKRSEGLRFYPGYWNGISGFLDDDRDVEEKVREELSEEIGISPEHILSIGKGEIFHQNAPDINKTWIVHPICVVVDTEAIKLDWENQTAMWISDPSELDGHDLLPGFETVLKHVLKIS